MRPFVDGSSFLKSACLLVAGMLLSAAALAGSYEDFFFALHHDLPSKIEALLRRGFDPNTVDPQQAEPALIVALREDQFQVATVLINASGIDLEARAKNGDTALMIASYKKNLAMVEALIAKDAEINRPGWTALHYAAAVGANDVVKRLLEESAYIDAESPNQTTPLMMAARGGHILTVKLLLDEGADATLKNDQGLTAIDLATKFEHKDIAEGLTYRLKKAGKL